MSNQYTTALPLLTQIIADGLSPPPVVNSAYLQRATCYFQTKQFPLAVTDYTQVISNGENQASVFSGRGTCYKELGRYDLAIADFTKATSLDPFNAQLHEQLVYLKTLAPK